MDDVFEVLEKSYPEISRISDAEVGRKVIFQNSDLMLIIQRRLDSCDLKNELTRYTQILSKNESITAEDIAIGTDASVKIGVLLKAKELNFNDKLRHMLLLEYQNQVKQLENIIRLSKIQFKSSKGGNDKQENTFKKNEAIMEMMTSQMNEIKLKQKDDRKEELKVEEAVIEPEPEIRTEMVKQGGKVSIVEKLLGARKKQAEIKETLNQAIGQTVCTLAGEIPYKEKKLVFGKAAECVMMPGFSLVKRKENIYFGRTSNITRKTYDNSDDSLLELTKAGEDFYSFMTKDLLSEDYEILEFSENDTKAMIMYFDFCEYVFKQNMSESLTANDYVAFKTYYGKLVVRVMEAMKDKKNRWFQAMSLADEYISLLRLYKVEDEPDISKVTESIYEGKPVELVRMLNSISREHMTYGEATEKIDELKEKIERFHFWTKCPEVETKELIQDESNTVEAMKEEPEPKMSNSREKVKENVQIVVQVLSDIGDVVDEAVYARTNFKQAMVDYDRRPEKNKRIIMRTNGKEIEI